MVHSEVTATGIHWEICISVNVFLMHSPRKNPSKCLPSTTNQVRWRSYMRRRGIEKCFSQTSQKIHIKNEILQFFNLLALEMKMFFLCAQIHSVLHFAYCSVSFSDGLHRTISQASQTLQSISSKAPISFLFHSAVPQDSFASPSKFGPCQVLSNSFKPSVPVLPSMPLSLHLLSLEPFKSRSFRLPHALKLRFCTTSLC